MPTYICQTLLAQCKEQAASASDAQSAQEDCEDNIKTFCGTLDVADADTGGSDDSSETSASSPSPSATGDSGDDDDDSGNSDDVTTTNSDDFAAPTAGPQVVAALGALGLVAAFV